MNIILIGLKNSGKTTVGEILAKKLQRKFIDIDELILRDNKYINTEQTIYDVFQKLGEVKFRQQETKVIRACISSNNCVLATGGGSLLTKDNVVMLKSMGSMIYLSLSKDEFAKRISNQDSSTYLQSKSLHDIYNFRHPYYELVANHIVDVTNKSNNSIVDHIMEIV